MARFGLIMGRCGVDLGSIWGRFEGRTAARTKKVRQAFRIVKTNTKHISTPPRTTRKSIQSRSGRRRGSHVRSEPSSGCPGPPQKPFGTPPGRPGTSHDRLGRPRGVPKASPRAFWSVRGAPRITPWTPRKPQERLGVDLGSIWGRFGVDLSRFGSLLRWMVLPVGCPFEEFFLFRPISWLRRPCNDLSAASVPQ